MNLEERMVYLQHCMEEAMRTGASWDDIAIYESTISEMVEIAASNWRAGRTARLYFEAEIRDGDTLSIDANSITYQVMIGKQLK